MRDSVDIVVSCTFTGKGPEKESALCRYNRHVVCILAPLLSLLVMLVATYTNKPTVDSATSLLRVVYHEGFKLSQFSGVLVPLQYNWTLLYSSFSSFK